MLLPTMTPEEIYSELHKDADGLWAAITSRFGPEFNRLVRRGHKFPLLKVYFWNSKNTFVDYRVIFIAYRKAEHKFVPHILIYTMYSHETGRNLVYIEPDHFAIRIYTPHFMQRYKEREPRLAQATGELANLNFELLFILKNHRVQETTLMKQLDEEITDSEYIKLREKEKRTRFWQDPDYERYAAACELGLCLCERNKANLNISIYNTFIAYEMLQPTQYIDFAHAVVPVVLDRIALYYPRQKAVWQKEWNDFNKSLIDDNTLDVVDKTKAVMAKLDEFNRRYPITTIF